MSETLCSYEGAVDLPTDLTFIIKEGNGLTKKLEAHKYHLSKASPVFRALIYNKWQTENRENKEVVIENTDYDSFKAIIDYVYTNNMSFENMTIERVEEIERLADWYHIPAIKEQLNTRQSTSSCSIYHYDHFLKLTPTDVTFEIEVVPENAEDEEKNSLDNIIEAHRYHLAIFSPVFKTMFFGPLKQDKVTVKGTSIKAFKFLIDWIYGSSSMLSSLSIHDQFHVHNLGELYDVPGIKILAENQIMGTKLTRANALEVAFEAENWSQFQNLSDNLWRKSVVFLSKEVLRTKKDIIKFSATNSSFPLAATAFRIVAELPDCQNCFTDPCLQGKRVQRGEARVGIKVNWSRNADDVINSTVTSTRGTEITLETEDGEKVTFIEDDGVFFRKNNFKEVLCKAYIYWNCD